MDEQPQHAQLTTTHPQHAAVPVCPTLRAGKKRAVDFDVPFRRGLLCGIILRHLDDSFLATPGSLGVLFSQAYFLAPRRTHRCAHVVVALRWRRTRPPGVRRGACLPRAGASADMGMYSLCARHVETVSVLLMVSKCYPIMYNESNHYVSVGESRSTEIMDLGGF